MMNCLTIQNRVDYYCSVSSWRDAYQLQDTLQLPLHQANAHTVHLLMHRTIHNRSALFRLLEVIGQLPNLRQVSVSILQQTNKRFPASALALLLRTAKNLQVLRLEDLDLEESPYELAEVVRGHSALHTVRLVRCYCSPVHVLLHAMARMPRLRYLSLDGSILAQQREPDAVSALASLVGHSRSLQKLEFLDIEETGMSAPLLEMMEALQQLNNKKHTTGLSELSFHVALHETMPCVVVRAMARMLMSNTSLQRLTVPWTGGGEAWLPVVEALAYNRSLKEFMLHFDSHPQQPQDDDTHCCLSHHFLKRAAHVLRDHNTHLSYFWYDSWEDIDLEIDLYVRSNRLGRAHLVYDDDNNDNNNEQQQQQRPTHDEWVRALVSSRDHVHVTNYWLTHNPGLLVTAVAKTA